MKKTTKPTPPKAQRVFHRPKPLKPSQRDNGRRQLQIIREQTGFI